MWACSTLRPSHHNAKLRTVLHKNAAAATLVCTCARNESSYGAISLFHSGILETLFGYAGESMLCIGRWIFLSLLHSEKKQLLAENVRVVCVCALFSILIRTQTRPDKNAQSSPHPALRHLLSAEGIRATEWSGSSPSLPHLCDD